MVSMEPYLDTVASILRDGQYKPNRTSRDTISSFSQHYRVNLSSGFPLLTTKDLSGGRWETLVEEFEWYLSGNHHIRRFDLDNIWGYMTDKEDNLPTAYGRFWRRYPIPEQTDQLDGEWWPEQDAAWFDDARDMFNTTDEELNTALDRWINKEDDGRRTIDQLQYVADTLNGNNPMREPESRRLVVNAWHPSNAIVSALPPCHYTFVFNVQGDQLNAHLTQRSGDIALGIPFNIAAYGMLTKAIAKQTPFDAGHFSHTVVDTHAYCGSGDRGEWYGDNIDTVQSWLENVDSREEYLDVKQRIEEQAPEENTKGEDHVPRLLKQLSREPRERPTLEINGNPLEDDMRDAVELKNYNPADSIYFDMAE